jgi:hypothetical protein
LRISAPFPNRDREGAVARNFASTSSVPPSG